MKKSEFIAARRAHWAAQLPASELRAKGDVAAAEAAGVIWDHEEEPWPEELAVLGTVIVPATLAPNREISLREKLEAVRRWNAHARVRAKVEGLFPNWARGELLAILDGKEGA